MQVPVSPNFTVIITLDVIQGGGPESQFYLIDIGGCWKNNGGICDGDVDSDVTRYVEMIINPQTPSWCRLHLSLSLSLNFSSLDCPYVYRISVQEAVTHLFIDYLPIHKNRDFVFSYFCYALQCGFLNILRPLHFGWWQCLKWLT
jgi:hypothetical protein